MFCSPARHKNTAVEVTLWSRTAEVAAEYLHKGSPVLIEGRLKQETWDDNGSKRSKLKVVGERLQMLGKKTDGGGNGQAVGAATVAAGEEIPF